MKRLFIVSIAANIVLLGWLAVEYLFEGPRILPESNSIASSIPGIFESEPSSVFTRIQSLRLTDFEKKALFAAYLEVRHSVDAAADPRYQYWKSESENRYQLGRYRYLTAAAIRNELEKRFGASYMTEQAFAPYAQPLRRKYSFLPPAKQWQLYDLQYEYSERQFEVAGENDVAKAAGLREELERKVREVLTRDEYFEYAVRNSSVAKYLRSLNFDFTEEEFRITVTILLDDAYANSDVPIPAAAQTAIREHLGEARYRQFERLFHPGYALLDAASRHYGFTESQVSAAYEVITDTEEQLWALSAKGPVLSPADRDLRQALLKERSDALAGILGEEEAAAIARSLSQSLAVPTGAEMIRRR